MKQLHLINGLAVLMVVTLLAGCQPNSIANDGGRAVIGQTAVIYVDKLDWQLLARIDTGARTTSINAIEVTVEDASESMKANIGKKVTFTVVNANGEKRKVHSVITGVTQVRNAQGTEKRYAVAMNLKWKDVNKNIDVNLRDRSAMTYKLLIGRDWLSEDFMVNVDISEDIIQ